MNASIITARAGSKSIPNKNVFPVAGRPLIAYPIQASLDASRIDRVYVDTDGEAIAEVAREMGCEILWRPAALCGDDVNHGEVIKHAVEEVDRQTGGALVNVVLLGGNTVMVDGPVIDRALALLQERGDLDSVMTLWEAADDHPYRALALEDGLVVPFGDRNRQVSTARQSYPRAYYFDQGVWAFRKGTVQRRDGPNPWWWMGARCHGIVRPWVAGRDIHNIFDVTVAEWWVRNREEIRAILRSMGDEA